MHQGEDKQIHQYIVMHKVAHARAHRLLTDDHLSSSEILEFSMTLKPFIEFSMT